MKIVHQANNHYVLKIDRGEELVEQINSFSVAQQIKAGFFVGLGASSYLKLAWYNLETKKYEEKEFTETMEIAGLTGNIAYLSDQMIVHVHGSFSDRSLSAVAGHVTKLVIGGACEIMLIKFDTEFKRLYDSATGLNLLI